MQKVFAGQAKPGSEEHVALAKLCASLAAPWKGDYAAMCADMVESSMDFFKKFPTMHPAVRVSVTRDIVPYFVGSAWWAATGFPAFNLTLDFFRAVRVTDFGDAEEEEVLHCPYPAYLVRFPEALKDGIRTGFVYPVPVRDGDKLVFGIRRFSLAAADTKAGEASERQAYTQWSVGMTFNKFLNATPTQLEAVSQVERTATELIGCEMDPDLTKQARRVLGNTFLYINANGGLPTKKHLGADVPVEREHDTAPRFRIGRPIKLGPKIRAALEPGRTGAVWELEKRFVVRGHWRNQAFGPEHSLRRKQWIQPFWKGPEGITEAMQRTFVVD